MSCQVCFLVLCRWRWSLLRHREVSRRGSRVPRLFCNCWFRFSILFLAVPFSCLWRPRVTCVISFPTTRNLPRAVCFYSQSRSETSHFPSVPFSPSTQSLVRWTARITPTLPPSRHYLARRTHNPTLHAPSRPSQRIGVLRPGIWHPRRHARSPRAQNPRALPVASSAVNAECHRRQPARMVEKIPARYVAFGPSPRTLSVSAFEVRECRRSLLTVMSNSAAKRRAEIGMEQICEILSVYSR